ncbi:hypothetical protein SAMN05661093_03167 [Kibdelosporangium aridum]|uniref:Uncharacterized protein n=1 Tax=Kibdelosporangium aridum TaxID=2030 RepID=A0A1W2DDL2_KIBAR|nr:hypothetical protein SAMN05661093_03167 [Kibdelosporangium aridum]
MDRAGDVNQMAEKLSRLSGRSPPHGSRILPRRIPPARAGRMPSFLARGKGRSGPLCRGQRTGSSATNTIRRLPTIPAGPVKGGRCRATTWCERRLCLVRQHRGGLRGCSLRYGLGFANHGVSGGRPTQPSTQRKRYRPLDAPWFRQAGRTGGDARAQTTRGKFELKALSLWVASLQFFSEARNRSFTETPSRRFTVMTWPTRPTSTNPQPPEKDIPHHSRGDDPWPVYRGYGQVKGLLAGCGQLDLRRDRSFGTGRV